MDALHDEAKMNMKSTTKLIILALTMLVLTASANAQSPPEELLKQMVGQLQTTPNDNALREKIIKLGAEIKPAPAIPEEANRAFVKGNVFKEEAKDAAGYELAIAAYRKALSTAPWWGDTYFNLAVTLGLAEKFDEAIASFKFYIASVPVGSAESHDAQNKIYALEAKAEIAAAKKVEQDKVTAAAAEKRQAEQTAQQAQERFFKNLDGGVWRMTPPAGNDTFDDFYEVQGREIEQYSVLKPGNSTAKLNPDMVNRRIGGSWKMTFDRREFLLNQDLLKKNYSSMVTELKVIISEDAQTITEEELRLGRPVRVIYRRIN
jgi:tetratricopeptide (TPR) repeat protein